MHQKFTKFGYEMAILYKQLLLHHRVQKKRPHIFPYLHFCTNLNNFCEAAAQINRQQKQHMISRLH